MAGEMIFTKRVCRELVDDGAVIFPIVASVKQPPGWPDRLVVHRHCMVLLEFKGENTPISPAQRVVHTSLERRGRYAFFIRAPNEIWHGSALIGTFDHGMDLMEKLRIYIFGLGHI